MSLYGIQIPRLIKILPAKSRVKNVSDLKELLTELDFEQWLDTEGIIYRRGGVSTRGREVNIKECPVCGSSNWKVYFNLTNGVGKCFAGDHPEEIQFNKLVFLKHYSGKSIYGLTF